MPLHFWYTSLISKLFCKGLKKYFNAKFNFLKKWLLLIRSYLVPDILTKLCPKKAKTLWGVIPLGYELELRPPKRPLREFSFCIGTRSDGQEGTLRWPSLTGWLKISYIDRKGYEQMLSHPVRQKNRFATDHIRIIKCVVFLLQVTCFYLSEKVSLTLL